MYHFFIVPKKKVDSRNDKCLNATDIYLFIIVNESVN